MSEKATNVQRNPPKAGRTTAQDHFKITLKLQASLAPWKLYLKNEMWLKTSAEHFRYSEYIS